MSVTVEPWEQPMPTHETHHARIIALCGPKGSGKSTAAQYLLARNSIAGVDLFVHHPFAKQLKMACGDIFGLTHEEMNDPDLKEVELTRWPFKKPRRIMTDAAKLT